MLAADLRLPIKVTLRAQSVRPLGQHPTKLRTASRLRGKITDYRVNSSSCAPHRAMRDILRRNRSVLRNILGRYRRVLRYVSRGANRPSLSAANANSEREND